MENTTQTPQSQARTAPIPRATLKRQCLVATLPTNIQRELRHAPSSGAGVHSWIFTMALKLHRHIQPDEILDILIYATRNCGRGIPAREILDAIRNSARIAGKEISGAYGYGLTSTESYRSWPSVDAGLRQKVLQGGGDLRALRKQSPIMPPEDTEPVIEALFSGDLLLCCGRSKWDFETKPLSQWKEELRFQKHIVPSPMSAKFGKKQDGTGESMHTLANTGPRRFLVAEFDSGSFDDQAALLLHLGKFAPLATVVFSGNKSLHGWFYCQGTRETRLRVFFEHAVRLGADPATWTRSQFVRMPNGTRIKDGAEVCQTVLHFNPEVCSI